MTTQTNTKTLITILLAVIAIVAVMVIINSMRNWGLNVFLTLLGGGASLVLGLYMLMLYWNTWKLWGKFSVILLIGMSLFTTVSQTTEDWPQLPWVKTEAFNLVDEFMNDLKDQNYSTVTGRFTPRMQRCIKLNDLSQPAAHPVSWQLGEMDEFSNIHGIATFSDGAELPLTVRMAWSGSQWQINGFWFGMGSETRLDYSSMHCGEE